MIFIRTDENQKVEFIHYKPFDEKLGLKKTKEQLLKEGYLIESDPSPEVREGFNAIKYYDPNTNSIYFKYEKQKEIINEPTLEERISDLELALAAQMGN